MSKLQLVGSFIGFENGIEKGVHDFKIESNGSKGSIETLVVGCDTQTIELPTGLGDEFSMNEQQAFVALKHMQERSKSIDEAFGLDIEPSCEGIQMQGVVAMIHPEAIFHPVCMTKKCVTATISRMAFVYRDGYLMVSSLDANGNWNSDAEKIKKALEGFSFKDLSAIICKILASLSLWSWAKVGLIALCIVGTSGAAAIGCALLIIGLELITIAMLIAIIEEVTGQRIRIASFEQGRKHWANGQLASAKEALAEAHDEALVALKKGFKHKELGQWLAEKATIKTC